MNGGLEFLFWILFFSLIVIAAVIAEIVERVPRGLPAPRPDCVDRGPMESWEAGEGRVRIP